ncbi:hypothetical protein SAMN02745216_01581 [Desulfatibacillum alkenivorans DSM 16219]|jgi:hypothetical protein|uniref:Dockerin domain-containing protein n=1 Tax=Desulfatibacillum alkenivorans DSM 16219 TaxID=1121393 RepID=A0A1M6IZX6_9BACT|nr:hypothetical protein [Desulfatibacillum alkenivorans]SHJ40026.1 hypothetical protein SAMN02745216_01581 [Desulfatibacillum alkenivorans DSM 16219]
MKRKLNILLGAIFALILASAAQAGPYAPAAGEDGSTAVSMDDASIKGWATGYTNLVYGEFVDSTWKTPEKALGAATGEYTDIVSLGRGGRITLTFSPAVVTNGEGFDFAIFENSTIPGFFELAYVEVSSDGVNFVRLPNDSLTAGPVGAYENSMDPTNIDGLAGKYIVGYGTPFDLDSVLTSTAVTSGTVDLSSIKYVRLVDIVGDGTYLDSSADVIYDPYATIGSAGFDLEAAGYMNYFVGGDLNLDDKLDMTDAVLALQTLAGAPASVSLSHDADGKITLADVLFALSRLAEQ